MPVVTNKERPSNVTGNSTDLRSVRIAIRDMPMQHPDKATRARGISEKRGDSGISRREAVLAVQTPWHGDTGSKRQTPLTRSPRSREHPRRGPRLAVSSRTPRLPSRGRTRHHVQRRGRQEDGPSAGEWGCPRKLPLPPVGQWGGGGARVSLLLAPEGHPPMEKSPQMGAVPTQWPLRLPIEPQAEASCSVAQAPEQLRDRWARHGLRHPCTHWRWGELQDVVPCPVCPTAAPTGS